MMVEALQHLLQGVFGQVYPLVWTLLMIVVIIVPLLLGVAYLTFWERKVIGWMQVRIGPNRVGPWGLIQPIADGVKLLLKEVVVPSGANKWIFLIAPMFAFAPALAAWAVIPFNDTLVLADIDASLLYIMAITSMGVYGVILAGWASNSKYAFLGGMRSAAQMISYELAMGFALVTVLMVSKSLNLATSCAQGQGMFADRGLGFLSWNWLPLAADVRGLPDRGRGRNQPLAVRRGRRRIGDRPVSMSSIRAWRSRCSSWPNTRT
jgi:NADH-quinone oxidoreductase subunit H